MFVLKSQVRAGYSGIFPTSKDVTPHNEMSERIKEAAADCHKDSMCLPQESKVNETID